MATSRVLTVINVTVPRASLEAATFDSGHRRRRRTAAASTRTARVVRRPRTFACVTVPSEGGTSIERFERRQRHRAMGRWQKFSLAGDELKALFCLPVRRPRGAARVRDRDRERFGADMDSCRVSERLGECWSDAYLGLGRRDLRVLAGCGSLCVSRTLCALGHL